MSGVVRESNGFKFSRVYRGFALVGLAVVRCEEVLGLFVGGCVIAAELSEAAHFIDDVDRRAQFEGAQAGEVVGAQRWGC